MNVMIASCAVLAVLGGAGLVTAQTAPAAPKPGTAAPKVGTAPPQGIAPVAPAAAAPAPAVNPVVFPHLHLHVKDLAASRTFWVGSLGGTPVKVSTGEAIKFPGGFVFLQPIAPKGSSKGSVVDHVAFEVRNIRETVAAVKKAGFMMATRAETNSVYVVTDDVAFLPDRATFSAVAIGPDEMSVELIENKKLATPIAFRHIHFAASDVTSMKDWYVKALGARVGARGFGFEGLDLGSQAGVLMFTLADDKVVGTEGRVNDRIGFEVRSLAPLGKKLERLGAKVTRPYGKSTDTNAMSVVLTDPWGTSIELTEGLNALN